MKEELVKSLTRRFGDMMFQRPNLYVSTLLDPRYKANFFREENRQEIISSVKEIIKKYVKADASSERSAKISDDEDDIPLINLTGTKENLITFWDTFRGIASTSADSQKVTSISTNTSKWEQELQNYLASPPVSVESIFEWWEAQNIQYPNLFKLGLMYLSSPAASVSSEQLFSQLGNIYEPMRNRLKPEKAEQLLFLHSNLRKLKFKY